MLGYTNFACCLVNLVSDCVLYWGRPLNALACKDKPNDVL